MMNGDKFRFSIRKKDINEAVRRGRIDERNQCEKEKSDALEQQRFDIEGEYYLKMVDLQGKVHSLQMKNVRLEKEVKLFKDRDNEVKEIHLQQKQIASDLSYFVSKWQQEKTEELQEFLMIQQRLENMDDKALKKLLTTNN